MLKLLFVIMIVASSCFAATVYFTPKHITVDMKFDRDVNLTDVKYTTYYGEAQMRMSDGDFYVEIFAEDNRSIDKAYFFVQAAGTYYDTTGGGGLVADEEFAAVGTVDAKYYSNMRRLEIKYKDDLLYAQNFSVSSSCNLNTDCDSWEDRQTCFDCYADGEVAVQQSQQQNPKYVEYGADEFDIDFNAPPKMDEEAAKKLQNEIGNEVQENEMGRYVRNGIRIAIVAACALGAILALAVIVVVYRAFAEKKK